MVRKLAVLLPAVACCTAAAAAVPRTAAADPVVYVGGDIACDPADPGYNGGDGTPTSCRQKATSDIIGGGGFDAVIPLGDLQYEDATLSKFQQSYDPTWGRFKAQTYPVIGNHEGTTAASGDGYCAYFGAAAHCNASGVQGGAGYYSVNIGAWHVVVLNSNCDAAGGCDVGSPQYQWLAADLAANPRACTLAAWHHPRWSSGEGGNNAFMQPIWQLFYADGGDLVLAGHAHVYERFAPMDGSGAVNWSDGMRSFVVGTGGVNFFPFVGPPGTGSEVRENTVFGAMRLVLHPTSYEWSFSPAAGGAFTDSGVQSCRALPDTVAPSAPARLSATAKAPKRVNLTWAGSADNVGVAGYEIWRGAPNGPMAPIATAAAPGFADTSVAAGKRYAYQVRARDAAGNVSAMSNADSVTTPTSSKRRRGTLLARWRLKRAVARRALARGRARIRARRWAPTVITVSVGGRVAATRKTRVKHALTLRLASWSKRHRYRHRTVVVTIRRPV
ncbi:metallophosphoesterase [Candidatus Solirubrobacter pratensis]|uniref:metallophosphoesterase n=1 Tax=Candidatus Solirubrobacter pratensis TaxID=1298857 RepID=UPI0009DC0E21|nr:metallophosphoesterase [Candidatus Solirubrobacter pratensis]